MAEIMPTGPTEPLPSNPPNAPSNASAIDLMINHAAQQYNLDPAIFRAQLMQESGLQSGKTGPGGELGIAQFMPATAKAFNIDPRVPEQAIPAAALYMRQHLNRFGGDYRKALAAYNAGPGRIAAGGADAVPAAAAYADKILGAAQRGGGGGTRGPGPTGQPGPPPLASIVAPGPAAAPAPAPLNPALMGALTGGVPGAPTTLADAFARAAQAGQQNQIV